MQDTIQFGHTAPVAGANASPPGRLVDRVGLYSNTGAETVKLRAKGSETVEAVDTEQNRTLATVTQQPGSAVQVDFFNNKGGFFGVLSDADVHVLALPDTEVKLNGTHLSMAPNPKSLHDPFETRTEAIQPSNTPTQQETDTALILGAGLSSRVEPAGHYSHRSKPAFPLDAEGNTFINRIANLLKQHGIKNLVVNTFYHPEVVKDSLADQEDLSVDFIDEKAPSGTAGVIPKLLADPKLRAKLGHKPLLIMSGDSLTNVDVSKLLQAHKDHNAAVSIASTTVEDQDLDKFGIIVTDQSGPDGKSGQIQKFVEKPAKQPGGLEQIGTSRLANIGAYVISPEVFPLFEKAQQELAEAEATGHQGKRLNNGLDFAENIFPKVLKALENGDLQKDGKPMTFWAQDLEGYWADIGNLEQYMMGLTHVEKGLMGDKPNMNGFFHDGVAYWGKDTHQLIQDKQAEIKGRAIVTQVPKEPHPPLTPQPNKVLEG